MAENPLFYRSGTGRRSPVWTTACRMPARRIGELRTMREVRATRRCTLRDVNRARPRPAFGGPWRRAAPTVGVPMTLPASLRFLLAAALAAAALLPTAVAQPIKLGELNSYKVFPAFLEPYKKGMELALDEVNAAGGVLGRPLEIVSRDDNGSPGDAVRVAEELISREKVALLMGTFPSNVGPRRRRPRQAAQGAVPRRRAADRQDRLGERQHATRSGCARRRTCRRRCSCPRRRSSARSAGRSSTRTTSTGSRRPRRSRSR